MASTDDPEKCVTVTVPQLQEMLAQGKSELAASQQLLMHEQKEREKTEALLEQQRHFAQASAAEAAAREAELRKSLETARGHATQELNDSKAFWQGQLARASEALQAAEAEAAAWREEAVALQEEVQHGIETCAYSADKAHLMLAEAVQRAEQEQFQMRASTEARIAAARAKQTEAEGRALAIGLALVTDREALQRAQQEAAVAADVHHQVEKALAAARAEVKASEAELTRCRDRHEADEAALARLAEEQRQMIAAAEEDSKASAQEIQQLRCECTQAFAALEDARARGLELEGELQHARTRLDEVLDREARQVGANSCVFVSSCVKNARVHQHTHARADTQTTTTDPPAPPPQPRIGGGAAGGVDSRSHDIEQCGSRPRHCRGAPHTEQGDAGGGVGGTPTTAEPRLAQTRA